MFKALFVASLGIANAASAEQPVDLASASTASVPVPVVAEPASVAPVVTDRATLRSIAEWQRLRAGRGNFDDAARFLASHPDWPGLGLLRKRVEEDLPIGSRPDDIIAFFADAPPQTPRGARALAAAYRSNGALTAAEDRTVETWRTMILSKEDEEAVLAVYGDLLKPHHTARLDMLLWRGAVTGAERMLLRVDEGWQALAKARMALRANKKNVDGLIKKVPQSLQTDPGLAFERMQWRARKRRDADAIELMLTTKPDALGQPERWAGWRRSFARSEMRAGRTKRAYDLASQHGLTGGGHFADLEWLSGYLALTYQKDGDRALKHFLRFRSAVETPISLGRAGYWEARAHELRGDAEAARLAYAFGAEYQTSFYGLLAAESAGVAMDTNLVGDTVYPDWKAASFAETSVFKAARYFMTSGRRNVAEQFLRHMAETLPAEEIGSLGDFVLAAKEPHLAVMIGKQAARRGIVVPRAYYPIASLGLLHDPVPRELSLAIARRESEFDTVVTSGAGAQGLMQVMPATARAVARDLNVRYDRDRLLEDPAYNARLGTAYLDELMEIFDGNIVMTAAGYNAGPNRPIRWMAQRGDPRQGPIDIVDWIEHIPFDETRNYVMRVAESLPIYRAQLTGQVQPMNLSEELIARPGHIRQARKGEYIRPRPRPIIEAETQID
ncbi:MAG: lytic transglycosylase domain-containing protein [Pseudomonadota bacterium]